MKILYIDIDSLRPDHLGCYGYHRNTSPNIDQLAQRGVRFTNVFASDAPCLPSRTALFGVQFGIHNGVVGHGGTAADPFIQGPSRGFHSRLGTRSWLKILRQAGYLTATVSTFGERHSAWHWYAGFQQIFNHGTGGMERADEVYPYVKDWLEHNAHHENWFLHVNFWDPHTPFRTPDEYGNPFADEPAPSWLTQEVLDEHQSSYGPHSAQEVGGYDAVDRRYRYPRTLAAIHSLEDFKTWIDGYDTGIRYADDYVGHIVNLLKDLQVYEDTLIIVSADHGENQGELNVYGDHQTADIYTCNIPLIISGQGVTERGVDTAFHYHLDLAPTIVSLLGLEIPHDWDGVSYAHSLSRDAKTETGRPYLVVSQGAWACQRAVRFDDWLLIRSYDPGLKNFEPIMLFNVKDDPRELHNVAADYPDVRDQGLALLESWHTEQMARSVTGVDPMRTVLREGGPYHTREQVRDYAERLRATGRAEHADRLIREEGARRATWATEIVHG